MQRTAQAAASDDCEEARGEAPLEVEVCESSPLLNVFDTVLMLSFFLARSG